MTILNIDSSNEFRLQAQTLVGRSIAVLGITGSGKTNTAAVLIEELLLNGLPLTIIDIEGEYWGLKEKFEVLVAGRSQHSELELGPNNAAQLAEISVSRSIPVILDLSDFTQEEAYLLLTHYFTSLWNACFTAKQPYQIVLEEAHEFIPQGMNSPLKQILTRIALRGRKRGLGIILISQRSAKVEKDVLTQTSLLFLHKVVHPIDIKVYKDLVPLPSVEVEEMIRNLQSGEAIVIYNHEVHIIHIRYRNTFHVSSTPTHEPALKPKLRKLDETMLIELRNLVIGKNQITSINDERTKLAKRIKELEEVLIQKDGEIDQLKSQIDLLSKLSISIENLPNGAYVLNPHTMEIDQAIIRQIITSEKPDNMISLSATSFKPLRDDTIYSELAFSQIEKRKLEALHRRLQKLPRMQRSILHLLAEHESSTMSIPMIATWLSLNENTIRSKPPHDLLQMKLITRTRSKSGYKYKSSFSSYLREEFPNQDTNFLIRYILQ